MKSIHPNVNCDGHDNEESEYEANTYPTETGYRIEYYHNDVGQVIGIEFDTLTEVWSWYHRNNYENFSS